MANWTSTKATANGIQLHYQRTGGDKPSIVIAHGVTDHGPSWRRVAAALAADFDVITYDQRGHGDSDAPTDGYAFPDQAEDMLGLINVLELEQPHLIGHSGGGAVAAIVAATHSAAAASLTLVDPPWGTAWGDWTAMTAGIKGWFNHMRTLDRTALLAMGREDNPAWRQDELELWVESKLKVSPHVATSFDQPAPDWAATLKMISCPIMFVVGDQERGALNTPADIQRYQTCWQSAQVAHIAGSGHMVHYDQFDAFIATERAFLASL